MEGEPYTMSSGASETKPLSGISFIPPELIKKEVTPQDAFRGKFALVGMGLGGLALVSWIVILFGVFLSIAGIVASYFGLKSNHPKCARVGMALSILALIASIWYVFAAYSGSVNYNYFTSEFWTSATSTTK